MMGVQEPIALSFFVLQSLASIVPSLRDVGGIPTRSEVIWYAKCRDCAL